MCFSVEINRDLKYLSNFFNAQIDQRSFLELDRLKEESDLYKTPAADNRIFPNVYAPVIISSHNQNILTPMRYRLRPHDSKQEVPSKYNLFNARLDSLTTRKTWRPLLGKNHGLFPFVRFFEWVEHEGKKKLISFYPKNREIMWAPCLYDLWREPSGKYSILSFALITDEPPKEILEMGHDRCPIFLNKNCWQDWLNPRNNEIKQNLDLLKNQENVFYDYQWAK